MPKIVLPTDPSSDGATVAAGGDGDTLATAPASGSPASVEAVRASGHPRAEHGAEPVGAVLDALALPAPAFLATLPPPGARANVLAPADDLLGSDLWPDAAGVAELVGRLRTFLASAGAAALFTAGAVPVPFYRRPRLSFRAGDTAADVAERVEARRRLGRPEPVAAPAGHARYECALTARAFVLPLGAPVPRLVFDTDAAPRSPFDFAGRSPRHPREYVGAEPDGAAGFDVHPALVEAGPAHVLGAAWARVEARVFDAAEALADVCSLAAALSGVEPEAVTPEWPALAYRRWERVERPGEARTWRRSLAGVGTSGAGM